MMLNPAQPLVSVVIPVYNGERFLQECLDNVFGQTYRPIEVVVVDDGSTDRTGQILGHYSGPIQVVRGEHRNLPSARNRGIKASSGELIAFLDVDDLWREDKIEKQVNRFSRNPKVDLVFTGVEKMLASGKRRVSREKLRLGRKLNRTEAFPLLVQRNFITPSSVMIRRSVFDVIGLFDEILDSSEDWEYWLRLAAKGVRMAFVDEILVRYRAHETNMSRDANRMHEGRVTAVRRVFDSPELPERLKPFEGECLAGVHYESANAFYNAGETDRFENCFRNGWRLSKKAAPWKAVRRYLRFRLHRKKSAGQAEEQA